MTHWREGWFHRCRHSFGPARPLSGTRACPRGGSDGLVVRALLRSGKRNQSRRRGQCGLNLLCFHSHGSPYGAHHSAGRRNRRLAVWQGDCVKGVYSPERIHFDKRFLTDSVRRTWSTLTDLFLINVSQNTHFFVWMQCHLCRYFVSAWETPSLTQK